MKPAVLVGAAAAFMAVAGTASAAWTYFPIPGGALAYDLDSRRVDLASGAAVADVLTYYFVPQAVGPKSFNIRSERMEFDCRGNHVHTLALGLFEDGDAIQVLTTPTEWADIKPGTPPAVFQRVLCLNNRPPNASDAKDQTALRAALHALPMTSLRTTPVPVTSPSAQGKPALIVPGSAAQASTLPGKPAGPATPLTAPPASASLASPAKPPAAAPPKP